MEGYEKRGYLLENFRLFHLRSEGGTKTALHYHEFCKILLLVSGQGGYYVDGQHYLLSPGDIVLVGSRSLHRPELEDSVAYERIIIYISPEYLQQMSTPDCDLLSVFSGKAGHVLRLKEPQRKKIFGFARDLERELAQEAFGREILSSCDLLRLLVEIGRSCGGRELLSPVMPKNQRVLEIMQYLDKNLTEQIDIDRLADTFYISRYYMMRLFRRETGATIFDYVTQKRLLLARKRMESGMSATEACYACGFRNYSSFTRAYGKYFGTTPTGRVDHKLAREESFE